MYFKPKIRELLRWQGRVECQAESLALPKNSGNTTLRVGLTYLSILFFYFHQSRNVIGNLQKL